MNALRRAIAAALCCSIPPALAQNTIDPVTQTLDPSIQESTIFGHSTTPQPNLVQSLTPVLISDTRVYNATLQQGFLSGGSVSVNFTNHYLNENSPTDILNPSSAPNL